jgi:solute carrier family 35
MSTVGKMTEVGENFIQKRESTKFQKLSSAFFFGLSSFLITVVNKRVLTSYQFPSFVFLSLGQLVSSALVLSIGKQFRIVSFPSYSNDLMMKIFPLPLFFLGNMVFGLGGTQALSLPMFAALRRISIMMTMFLEFYILNIKPSKSVQISVYGMVAGALLAASDDLAFNLNGYTMLMLTDVFTSGYGVFIKQKLNESNCGTYGLMFYNSLLSILPVTAIALLLGDIDVALKFDQWSSPSFVLHFLLSCVMCFVLNYSSFLCIQHNSPLTTAIVGCLKNVTITYIGMFIGGDYIFSPLNFIGLNFSVFASILYSYVTFVAKKNPVVKSNKEEKENLLEKDDIETV